MLSVLARSYVISRRRPVCDALARAASTVPNQGVRMGRLNMRFEVAIPCRDGLLWRMDGGGMNTPE
eukprot:scaffold42617_cov57-Phaeocystis_antarctica.AAC.4